MEKVHSWHYERTRGPKSRTRRRINSGTSKSTEINSASINSADVNSHCINSGISGIDNGIASDPLDLDFALADPNEVDISGQIFFLGGITKTVEYSGWNL